MRSLPFLLVTCLALLLCTSQVVRDVPERAGAARHGEQGPGVQEQGTQESGAQESGAQGPGAQGHRGRAGARGHTARGPGVEQHAYSYGPLPRQRLVAYSDPNPARPGPRRTGLLVVHGGFWYQQRSAGWNRWAGRIAAAGPAVFSLDYRRNTDAPWPAQRDDVLRALRWIRHRADRFGLDPQRIVLLGSSAGGQVAAAAGTYGAGRRHIAGVVALSPVADPYRAWRTPRAADGDRAGLAVLRANAERLAGCDPSAAGAARKHAEGPVRGPARERERARSPEACLRVWRDMSAAGRASGADDPPMLLVHSRHDFVPVAHSRAVRDAEVRHGMAADDVTVMTVPGDKHGGGLLTSPGVERTVLSWIAARTTPAPAPYGRIHR
ncbi:alpha/beta hydrolase [Streptomyces sp. HNM0575]|uniref:alpha/beta hydrolase fold domain-containing protein n=1 Tax=Streptomyces sp. HNM0575 TaxID=2716338 RepID=UPI00145D3D9C|nr:alpha/beta hydrolase [Streptomyces sp. HNM0575]